MEPDLQINSGDIPGPMKPLQQHSFPRTRDV